MKKLVALMLALMLTVGCMVFAQAEAPEKKTLTLMVFMCGTNLEYPNQHQGSASIAGMARSQYNVDEINVVVLAGGTKKWYGDSQLQVLQLQEDGSYTFAYASDDVVVEDNQLTAEYAGTALYATDKDGNRLSAEIAYDVIDGDTIMIPADLTMKGEDGESEDGGEE